MTGTACRLPSMKPAAWIVGPIGLVFVCLSACGHSGSPRTSGGLPTVVLGIPSHGLPSGSTHLPDAHHGSFVTWDGARRLNITTYGSGSCPALPTAVRSKGEHQVVVRTTTREGACTADLSPTTSVIALPQGIDTSAAVSVDVDGAVTLLPPAP